MKPEPDPRNADRGGTISRFPFVDLIDAYFEWDVGSDKTVFSPLLHKLTGYPIEEVSNDPGFWREVVHPGDFAALNSIRNWALAGGRGTHETRLRVKTRKGPWAWHLVRSVVAERDDGGAPLRVSGVMFDITEQEELKIALAETATDDDYEAIEVCNEAGASMVFAMARQVSRVASSKRRCSAR